ncbi:MAG: hypothetical protein DRI94_09470 [Bacteroidetes bacterium]|nr:MAG: hypothetical protein DRI94_09470 [Bacteroidota bacterium]
MNGINNIYKSIFFVIFYFLFSILYAQNKTDDMNNLKIYTGKIIKVHFVDKAGNEHKDAFNYFFETEDKQYFIKISEGDVSREEIEKFYNKKIRIKAIIILFGLWDTDDPNVQSRVGDYLILKEIL